jgi:antagonist of KipI
MSFFVLAPGLHTIPVSVGRPGFRRFGLPVGGPADRRSCAIAQALVGNAADATALEFSFAGPTLRAEGDVSFAWFGAPFAVTIDGRGPIEAGHVTRIHAGETLRLGGTAVGVRAYLAVPGGFRGLPERPVVAGDRLSCESIAIPAVSVHAEAIRHGEPLRAVPGPEFDWFLSKDAFLTGEFVVQPASNRMGVRLRGPMLERKPGELTSEPVAPGAVQITNDGHPVVLGVDGQTIGGYPRIVHVIRADLDRIGQLRPGDAIRFRMVTMAQAEAASAEALAEVREWELRLAVRRSSQ